ncbi:MAG: hypothetical protein PVF58_18175 [Candidatus Methanofastidiosia archaeon]
MKKFKKVLILVIVCVALTCCIWAIFSQSNMSVSKEVPPEDVPNTPEKLPPITSHEEAITITDEFLKEKLGNEFFAAHITFAEVDERPDIYSLWFVKYQYTYNEYTVTLLVAIDFNPIQEGTSRIAVGFSDVILKPQQILISEEQAKIIAQENGLEPPYTLTLSCEPRYYRICWEILKEDTDLELGDLAGFLIDAETGEILETMEEVF